MTFWTPNSFRWKLVIVFLFVVSAIVTVWLQEQKESRDKSRTENAQAELLNWQRGDPKNPPYVGYLKFINPVSNALTLKFTVENPSDFPAYEINVRVWNIDNLPGASASLEELLRHSITANIPSQAGHVSQIIGGVEILSTDNAKRFGAQFTTRIGSFGEKIRMQKVKDNWFFALQVTRSYPDNSSEVVFERVDSGFPLNEEGKVDWSMRP